jgi:ribosomal protein S18 acetylase RimI-like enzyme
MTDTAVIRPSVPSDTPQLVELARETGVFKPFEIDALGEVLDDFHAFNQAQGHRSVTCEDAGRLLGFAYYAPAAMTDRTWYLYWIAVTKRIQARGVGTRLLKRVEADIRAAGGRMLLIETSSLPHYDLTRRFYLKHGYHQAATIADFYADGDNLVVFSLRFELAGD